MFQEFWNVRRTCLLAVSFLFFLHRHDDVTPSWFRAHESHVLRVPNGNDMKKWSSPSSLSSPSVLVWFWAASRKQHSCLHLYCATTTNIIYTLGMDRSPRTLTLRQVRAVCTQRADRTSDHCHRC